MRGYIDIETTGLGWKYSELTVIGIGIERRGRIKVVQLYDSALGEKGLLAALDGVTELYSYNGARFDLPFIRNKLGIDLAKRCKHSDLMYACHKRKWMGGLKAVEKQLGIERKLKDVDGFMAVKLYWDYVNNSDQGALRTLLEYNKEDVVNLSCLRRQLGM